MQREAREFRTVAERLFGAKLRRGDCYPAELKRRAVVAAEKARRHGVAHAVVARELGVHPDTLRGWLRPSQDVALVPVRITESEAAARPVVHGPRGLRIEGLALADIAEILRLLA